ncbi:MAG: hydroxymethylglutaryl-CoA synthase family protein [Candidatus Lokiarchaeota archaeon]|nr:hydroxymethylglutaryl-CoA synthase family protein [Candidatus Lokiarchaeota archaeon]
MPVGIKSYGAYLPKYMLPREDISKAWDFPLVPGTKAVAMEDEDSLTMSVEAGLDCLSGIDPKTVDGVFFASTTQVYTEKDSASLIATVLDMRDDIVTADFTDSTKAGTTALARAVDTIKSNKDVNSILVVAADTRKPEPSTMWEFGFADGAAALLVADEENIPISIDDYYSVSANVTGPWKRADKDEFVRTFEVKTDGMFYVQSVTKAMSEVLKRNKLNPSEDIDIAAYYYNNPRAHSRISKMMKFGQGVAQDSLFFQVGDTGTPMPFMLLIASLRRPKPEAKIIMAGFGDGADAILMQVRDKDGVKAIGKGRMGFLGHQKSMTLLKNYNKFIEFKELLDKDRYTRKSSAVLIWRDTPSVYQWYGIKCKNCGSVQYPKLSRSCSVCRADDQFEDVKLAYKGELFTFTLDHLVGGAYLNTPVPRCVIDLEGGGRVLVDMTEIENPEKNVEIGMKVELTFRKYHEGGEFKNYYWKCRPVRGRP